METLVQYLVERYQPICGMILGVLMLVAAVATNYGDAKEKTLRWTSHVILGDRSRSDAASRRFLDGITLYLILLGVSLITLAVYFLESFTH